MLNRIFLMGTTALVSLGMTTVWFFSGVKTPSQAKDLIQKFRPTSALLTEAQNEFQSQMRAIQNGHIHKGRLEAKNSADLIQIRELEKSLIGQKSMLKFVHEALKSSEDGQTLVLLDGDVTIPRREAERDRKKFLAQVKNTQQRLDGLKKAVDFRAESITKLDKDLALAETKAAELKIKIEGWETRAEAKNLEGLELGVGALLSENLKALEDELERRFPELPGDQPQPELPWQHWADGVSVESDFDGAEADRVLGEPETESDSVTENDGEFAND